MIKVLFLAANPKDTALLALDEEMRGIDAAVRDGRHRDELDLRSHWAVRIGDLQSLLLRHRPDIVHFSGHGTPASEIMLQDHDGLATVVAPGALSALFGLMSGTVRCVVLNGCHSEVQAQGIAASVDCVVGMGDLIGDGSAIAFAGAFYRAVSHGLSVREAFELGRNEIALHGFGDEHVPRLAGAADPDAVRLTGRSAAAPARSAPVLDVGEVRAPDAAVNVGQVRFSVSDLSSAPIKITAARLEVLARRPSASVVAKVPAAAVDEYSLFADVRTDDRVELLDRHHVLGPGETDGFLLGIDASEGRLLELRLEIEWNALGQRPSASVVSDAFTIDFPAHTPAGMIAALKLRRGGA